AVGLELELIPILQSTHKPALSTLGANPSTAEILSQLGKVEGWTEQPAGEDPPSWELPDGARISFEPGGQLEISTRPHATASSVIQSTCAVVELLRGTMTANGIDL